VPVVIRLESETSGHFVSWVLLTGSLTLLCLFVFHSLVVSFVYCSVS